MRILLISLHSLNGPQPWARRSFNIVQALCDAGNEVTVLAPQRDLAAGLGKATLVSLPSFASRPLRVLMFVTALFRAISLMARHKFDAVHFAGSAVCLYALLPLIFRSPVVYDVWRSAGEAGSDSWLHAMRNRLERAVLMRMDTITCSCPMLEDELLLTESADRVCLIENAVNASRPEASDLGEFPVVVYEHAGGGSQVLEQVLRVVAKVRTRLPDVRLIVCAESVPTRKVEELVVRLELQQHCVFEPFADEDAQASLLAGASVLLLPEASGGYIDERIIRFMQSGTPIVATRIRAHKQFLDESRAVLTAVGIDDLAEGVARALREPLFSTALAREAQTYAIAHFTRSGFNCKVRRVYNGLSRR
jgi:glycosyltransferase involved in cell wall biosynthesis